MGIKRFQPPSLTSQSTKTALGEVSQVFDGLSPLANYPLITSKYVQANSGQTKRVSPQSGGMELVVPAAGPNNFGEVIRILVENSQGALRIRAASGQINGSTAYTLPAGYTTLITLESNGQTGWVNSRAANFPDAGDSLEYDGNQLNYVGNTDVIRLNGSSGNLGTVDISNLSCGGAFCMVAAAGDWTIEGFTSTPAKPGGFWFCFASSNTAVIGTISYEDATASASDRIRITNSDNFVGQNIQGIFFAAPSDGLLGGTNRWRFIAGASGPSVQTFSTSGLTSNLSLATNTRVLRVDTGNAAWSIDGITGGYPGRKLTILNASNFASTGTIVTSGSSASSAANQIVTPDNENRGGFNRYSAELEYDGTDSVWRIITDTVGGSTLAGAGLTYTAGTIDVAVDEDHHITINPTSELIFRKSKHREFWHEEFTFNASLSGGTTVTTSGLTASLQSTNWWMVATLDSGTWGPVASVNNHMGILRMTTGNTTDNCSVRLYNGVAQTLGYDTYRGDEIYMAEAIIRLPSVTSVLFEFGFRDNAGNNFIEWYGDTDVNNNIHSYVEEGGVSTDTDVGVAMSANAWSVYTILQETVGTIDFYLDNVLEDTRSANIPDAETMGLFFIIENRTTGVGTNKSIDIDYVSFESQDMGTRTT